MIRFKSLLDDCVKKDGPTVTIQSSANSLSSKMYLMSKVYSISSLQSANYVMMAMKFISIKGKAR